MSSTSILSRPTGPREVLTMLAMEAAAMTFFVDHKVKFYFALNSNRSLNE